MKASGFHPDRRSDSLSSIVQVSNLHLQFADKKWEAFRWNVINVENGNDVEEIDEAVLCAKACKTAPSMIILHTKKGYGVSFAEKAGPGNHSMAVTPEMLHQALQELA